MLVKDLDEIIAQWSTYYVDNLSVPTPNVEGLSQFHVWNYSTNNTIILCQITVCMYEYTCVQTTNQSCMLLIIVKNSLKI